MNRLPVLILLVGVFGFGTLVQASVYDESDGLNYDAIVNRLSSKTSYETIEDDPFMHVKFHLGVGITNTSFFLEHSDGSGTQVGQRGVQTTLGIDLFSPNWIAEGAVINFDKTDYQNSSVAIREFDLKFYHKTDFSNFWSGRIGIGLAGRYLTVRRSQKQEAEALSSDPDDGDTGPAAASWKTIREEITSPASMIFAGVDSNLSDNFSVGLDVGLRRSLVAEADYAAFDLTIRVDGHF